MIQWIVIAVVSAGAGLLMLDGDEPPTPPPVAAVVNYVPLSNALYWLGGCSVTCSMIAGITLVFLSNRKRREGR